MAGAPGHPDRTVRRALADAFADTDDHAERRCGAQVGKVHRLRIVIAIGLGVARSACGSRRRP
jgi:hypothetical protein